MDLGSLGTGRRCGALQAPGHDLLEPFGIYRTDRDRNLSGVLGHRDLGAELALGTELYRLAVDGDFRLPLGDAFDGQGGEALRDAVRNWSRNLTASRRASPP